MKDYSKENLDVTHYRNGDPIPFVKSEKEWSNLTTGAYCYYDNDTEKGVLYNWYAVNDSRGLAPEGWKIPTIEELELIDLTTGLPGGNRSSNGSYSSIGNNGYWWSSPEYDTDDAWFRYLDLYFGNANSYSFSKSYGFSVRCLKDEIVINKRNSMEVVIDGIVYVPKEEDKELESVILEEHHKFEVHPKELGEMDWEKAKLACASLGEGWRLPTRVELLLMYENKDVVGGFADSLYWSSTEFNNANAWFQYFKSGIQDYYGKYAEYYVRAVRSI